MAFPTDAVAGDTHTNPDGLTFVLTGKGGWKAIGRSSGGASRWAVGPTPPNNPVEGDNWYDTTQEVLKIYERDADSSQWAGVGNNAIIATSQPSNAVKGQLWYNPNDLNLYYYLVVEGTASWKLLASGSLTASQLVTGELLPLMWFYDDERMNFELFNEDPKYSFSNITKRKIINGLASDDSLDIVSTEGISSGEEYVVFDDTGLKELVRVSSRLSAQRLRLESPLAFDYSTSSNAYFARTSFTTINGGGAAIVKNGDRLLSRPLDALENWPTGEIAIRRTAQGTGSFKVEYRHPDDTVWINASLDRTRNVAGGVWRDEVYSLPDTGIYVLRITYTGNNGSTDVIDHIVLYSAAQSSDTIRMEKPRNISPAQGASSVGQTPTLTLSTFRSIYGLAQDGAEFQVAEDPAFSTLVVNTSSDSFASWVAKSGQSAAFKGIVSFAPKKFIAVGDGGVVKITTDGGASWPTTGVVTGTPAIKDIDWNTVDQFTMVGASGFIANSQDNGSNWTSATQAGAYSGTFYGVTAIGTTIVVVGAAGEIQRSTNAGSIWNKITQPNAYSGQYNDVDSDANGKMICVGNAGEIIVSANGGLAWNKRTPAAAYVGNFAAVAMNEVGRAIAVGASGEVQLSVDYGSNWQHINMPGAPSTQFLAVDFEGDNVVVVGANGSIYSSKDGGSNFILRPAGSGSTAQLEGIALDSALFGVAVGAGGAVQNTLRLEGVSGTTFVVPAGNDMLQTNHNYYWRGRVRDAAGFWSAYSDGTAFSTSITFTGVNQPQNLAPASGATNMPIMATLQSSPFSTFGGSDTHSKSQWLLSSDGGFGTVLHDSGESNDLLVHPLPGGLGLIDQQQVYFKVRHKGSTFGWGPYSVATSYKVVNAPANPTISSPTNDATGVSIAPLLTSSGFSTTAPGEVHSKSQWQISLNSNFTTLVLDTNQSNSLTSFQVPDDVLIPGTQYYIRVRHFGLNTGPSGWSNTVHITTAVVTAPTIATPTNNSTAVSTTPTLTSAAYAGNGGTHVESEWQVSSSSDFATPLWDKVTTGAQLLSTVYDGVGLAGFTAYYARVRHKGALGGYSAWSVASKFTTALPNAPTINSPTANATHRSVVPSFTSSAFSSPVSGETHAETQWQVSTDVNFTSIVGQISSTTALLAWTYNSVLTPNTQYFVRVRHRGSSSGWSTYSTPVAFTTGSVDTPAIDLPAANATSVSLNPALSSTPFSSDTTETHQSSQWQISTVTNFASLVHNSGEVAQLVDYGVPVTLNNLTTYYSRVRHKGSSSGWSEWSAPSQFTTLVASGTATYTTPGSTAWVVPAGVFSVCVLCIGGGGGGGNGLSNGYEGGGAGGGGSVYLNNFAVTPGQSLSVIVGGGGSARGAGGTSSFAGVVGAYGGQPGGTSAGTGTLATAGAGGSYFGGTSGAAGASGGSGNSGSDGLNGGRGGNAGGAVPTYQGGGGTSTAGGGMSSASAYGGGGSGGGPAVTGGGGANGLVRIMWGAGRSYPNNL